MIDNSKEDNNLSKRIDIFNILDENIEPNKELTWREELVQVKERYDNFDIDKMCARCIKEQYELGIKNSEGELITPIRCTGIYSFKNDTVSKYGEDIYNSMVDMMTAEQLDIAETTVNPLKWLGSTITDKKLFSPRNYQALMSLCSAKYKVLRCGRRCIAEYEPVLLSDGRLKAIKDIEIGDSVVTYYKGQAINKPVTDKIENGVKEVFRITLNDNRTVDCTSNHPLLLDGREWKSIEQGLKVGDKVTTLTDYHLFGDYSNVIEAKLLGYLLADGYIPDSMKQTPKFTSCTPAYIEEVRSLVEEKFGYKCNVRPRTESAAIDVYLTDSNKGTKNKVKEWLKDKEILGVKGDKNRKILNYISKYDKESFGYFVNRLWSGDGCVSLWTNASRPNGKRIEVSLTTSNKDLADTLKAIFIKLNINTRVAEQRRITNVSKKLSVCWKLIIGDSISIKNFFKLTGPIYGKEQNSKEALIEIEKRKYTKPVANSKFFDKRIKKIEKIGDINTYDISVADTHNFVVNGIVTHNTGKSFTMTVGALHRLVSRDNYRVLMVAPQDTMIKEIVELIEKFCNAMEVNPIVHQTQSPIHQITFNTGSTFKGVTAGANKAKAVRGKGGDLVILDECFPAKTQITMWDGTTKSISEIKKGDRVLSYDEVKNQLVIKRVTEARCNGKKDVYTFITVSGKKIHCTAEHPLWTREGWVPAFEAKSVATTKTKTGEYFFEGIIGSRYKSNELVYNFEVKDTHTYIADDFIVHNCDYLDPDAFTAILALLMDNADVEFWASSTPNGESILYKLANDPAYKEFHLPSFVVPQYTDELDKMFKSKLDDTGYNQEVRANFNSSRDGVYPLNFIKQATVKDEIIINKDYVKQNRKDCILIMGVDWNHDKVGTRIVIVCYDKLSGRYVILHKDKISKEGWSQPLAVEKIVQLNREFDLDHIYVDEGFGVAQASQLRLFAQQQFGKVPARHPDLKLAKVVAVKFGSSLDVKDPVSGEDYKKQTKQYMIEHSVDILTRGLIILHEENDADIIAQMKNYIVKNKSATGLKTFGYVDTQIADHDLDAYNLALHGFHQEYSEFVNTGPIVGVSSLLKQAPIQLDDQVSIVSHSTSMIINTRESFLKNKFRKGRTSQFKTRKVW